MGVGCTRVGDTQVAPARTERVGYGRRELERADGVAAAAVGDRSFHHVELGRAPALEAVETLAEQGVVVAGRDLLRRRAGVQGELAIALVERPRPEPCIRILIDGAAEVAEGPEGGPVARAARHPSAKLEHAAGEAELVPGLQHGGDGGHGDADLAVGTGTRARPALRKDAQGRVIGAWVEHDRGLLG